jgi:hypothetical protein
MAAVGCGVRRQGSGKNVLSLRSFDHCVRSIALLVQLAAQALAQRVVPPWGTCSIIPLSGIRSNSPALCSMLSALCLFLLPADPFLLPPYALLSAPRSPGEALTRSVVRGSLHTNQTITIRVGDRKSGTFGEVVP